MMKKIRVGELTQVCYCVTILKYYEDGGGGGATQSERSVVHAEGFS